MYSKAGILAVILSLLVLLPLCVLNPAQVFVEGCYSIDRFFAGTDFLAWCIQSIVIMIWVSVTVIGWALYGTVCLTLLEELLYVIEELKGK